MGVEYGVGKFVVDNFYELDLLEEICEREDKVQEIYLE